MKNRLAVGVLLGAATLMLAGCGKGSLSGMETSELVAKSDQCMSKQPTSPGRVTACENIRKECEKRRAKGNFAC